MTNSTVRSFAPQGTTEKKKPFAFLAKGKPLLYSLISIGIGLLIGYIIMLIVDYSSAGRGMTQLLTGAITRGMYSFGNILYQAAPLIGVGLAVAIASKAGVFNIGGSGQFTFGGCMALVCAHYIDDFVVSPWGFIICLAAGMLAGALWALIPALLKNYFNVNIVVSAIMMNYIAVFLCAMIINLPQFFDSDWNKFKISDIENCFVPQAGIQSIFTYTLSSGTVRTSYIDIGIIVGILAALILAFVFAKTTFGLRIKTSGQNETGAKYSGINNKKSLAYAMMISGAMAGMGAVFTYLGNQPTDLQPVTTVNSIGFEGISVALIGSNNPIGCILSAILLSYLNTSGTTLTEVGYNSYLIDVITSAIIYMTATVGFIGIAANYCKEKGITFRRVRALLGGGVKIKKKKKKDQYQPVFESGSDEKKEENV